MPPERAEGEGKAQVASGPSWVSSHPEARHRAVRALRSAARSRAPRTPAVPDASLRGGSYCSRPRRFLHAAPPFTSPAFFGLSGLGVGAQKLSRRERDAGCQAAPEGADWGNRGGGVGVTGTPSPGSRKSRFKDWPDRLLST